MTKAKFLVPFIIEIFKIKSEESAKDVLREEILKIVVRIFFGIILSAFIIYSLSIFVFQLNELILNYEHGEVITVFIFGLSALLGSLVLYILFKQKNNRRKKNIQHEHSLDLQKVAISFVSGLIEGVQKK